MTLEESFAPLGGLVVVELTNNVAGAWCGRQLAALGAEVWKIEDPERGDFCRQLGPHLDSNNRGESSVIWLYLNEAKRSAAVRVSDGAGLALLKQLLATADILLISVPASEAEQLGLDQRTLAAGYPRLVTTAVTPYGMTGPKAHYKGCELTTYAASGLMYITGEEDREPLQVGAPMAEFAAGQAAFAATVASILRRETSGQGAYVDLSTTEFGTGLLDFQFAFYIKHDFLSSRIGNLNEKGYPWGIFPCRNGYAAIPAGPSQYWPAVATITGIPELGEARFATHQERLDRRDELDALLLPWLLEHDKEEIFQAGQAAGLAWGYVRDAAEVAACPQLNAESFFGSVTHPELGQVATADLPYTFGPGKPTAGPAPLHGQHTRDLLERVLKLQDDEIRVLEERQVVKCRRTA